MSNIKAEITFGIERDKNNDALDTTTHEMWSLREQIEKLACELFGGYTWIDTRGGWVDPNKIIIREDGRILSILTTDNKTHEVLGLAKFIRDALNQSCVAVTITVVSTQFV